ncbi:kinase-like protein [Dichotomopilus funicola]|uniref:EKC/KEOPS complex subunit BUD32 n=1 Tax=Dichotomopilus funicola TaxID=1934379 RepID=A0AAN6VAB2_9PEZI|nr:kinase-like protein [Dichotomopilus funicola]
METDEIKYPVGSSLKDLVSYGISGLVVLDKASQTVIKTPLSDDCEDALARERDIYARLTERGGHPGILRYHGTITTKLHQRWTMQIAEALAFVHSAGVVHGDLTCHNVFLDGELNAKLADFAGSSLDGSGLLVCVAASHEYPGPTMSTQGDTFAFGSVLYEIVTGDSPFKGLPDGEIENRYKKGQFADTSSLGKMGVIIRNCWLGKYNGFDPLLRDLKGNLMLITPGR